MEPPPPIMWPIASLCEVRTPLCFAVNPGVTTTPSSATSVQLGLLIALSWWNGMITMCQVHRTTLTLTMRQVAYKMRLVTFVCNRNTQNAEVFEAGAVLGQRFWGRGNTYFLKFPFWKSVKRNWGAWVPRPKEEPRLMQSDGEVADVSNYQQCWRNPLKNYSRPKAHLESK